MTQVNLLPPDILQGQRFKRVTVMVIIAGAAVLALIVLFYVGQVGRLSSVHDKIDAQQTTNATIQQNIDALQRFEDLQVKAQQAQNELSAAYAGEVSYAGLLMDMSRVIPSEAYLSSMAITTQAQATTTATTGTTFAGSITTGGSAIGFDTLSVWLTRLEQVDGWVNPWMPTITADASVQNAFTFTTSVDLTQDVETPRGKGQVTTGG